MKSLKYTLFAAGLLLLLMQSLWAQKQPELETALIKTGRIWAGVTANGDKGNFDYRAVFFPNDHDIIGIRGQEQDLWVGAGFKMATTNWRDPIDTLHTVAIYGPVNEFMKFGKVVERMTNYVRHEYTEPTIDFRKDTLDVFGVVDPPQFGDLTCDQIVRVTTQNVYGVQVKRQIMAWGQTLNDDYLILDVELTNSSDDTLKEFHINVESNGYNSYRSNALNPQPGSSERYNPATTWQHYYGGRVGDSMRVFYEYSADDPATPGDNMGGPVPSQGGRLTNHKLVWYAILHASEKPYVDGR